MGDLQRDLSRLVTGIDIATEGIIPVGTAATGTVTSSGTTVVGTNTLFTREFVRGMVMYSPSLKQSRRIAGVYDDTHLILESAFSSSLSSATVQYVRPQYTSIIVECTGSADAVLQNRPLKAGTLLSYNAGDNVDPIIQYSASAANQSITFDVRY